ncbi:MAG: DNA-directed RNA polymerase subunit omega [Clostridia bacterium]
MVRRVLLTPDQLIAGGHNKYALTIAVAKRARQIHDGSPVMVDTDAAKPVTSALAEVVEERITYGLGVVETPPPSASSGRAKGDPDEEDDGVEETV